jgi:hypothetical protein
MRKKNQSFCFAISVKARCTLLFCIGCLVFTSTFAQDDSTWYGTHYYPPVKKPAKYYPRTWAEDSLAGYSYGHPATSTGCNVLTGGFSTIFEDAGTEHFNTFGINGEFMHPFSSMLGAVGDAGVYFGSNNGVSYNKIQVMVGASILPITPFDNKLIGIEPHLLAGFSRVGYNYKAFSFPGSTGSNTSFCMAAGTDITYPIHNNLFYARIDYNPTFAKTATGNNIRVGVGIDIPIGTACSPGAVPPNALGADTTRERVRCKASKNVKELKISLTVVEVIAKSIEEVANKIPRVEAKITLKPLIAVKQGEECCAEYGPPTSYTELKGSIEGAMEVNITLWGIPDLNYSVNLWPVLVVAEFKCKLFAGPTGKINLDGIGKFYGSLGNPDPTECKACLYLNIKGEANLRVGVKAGGSVKFFHWSPLEKGAGYDVTGKADEEIEVSAEASASIGSSFNGTWAGIGDCKKPPPGVHGTLSIGKAKVNLKVTVKLGPLSFDPSYEIPLFDGWDVSL